MNEEDNRLRHEEQDRKDFDLILAAYKMHGYIKGARSIHMALLHLEKPVIMNLKKIRRLMHKYGLTCPIRRPNPYRNMLRENLMDKTPPNVLDRRFRDFGPRKVLLTDITYLYFGNGQLCYLSTIKDAYTKEILSYELSLNLKEKFVPCPEKLPAGIMHRKKASLDI